MSMPYLSFSCDRCDFGCSSICTWGTFSYYKEGQYIRLNRTMDWCEDCASLTAVEMAPSVEELNRLRQQLADLEKEVRDAEAKPVEPVSLFARLLRRSPQPVAPNREYDLWKLKEDVAVEGQRLELFQFRQSPCRCLACGSTRILATNSQLSPAGNETNPAPPVAVGFQHPNCGGQLMVKHSHMRLNIRLSHRIYNPEGNFSGVLDDGI